MATPTPKTVHVFFDGDALMRASFQVAGRAPTRAERLDYRKALEFAAQVYSARDVVSHYCAREHPSATPFYTALQGLQVDLHLRPHGSDWRGPKQDLLDYLAGLRGEPGAVLLFGGDSFEGQLTGLLRELADEDETGRRLGGAIKWPLSGGDARPVGVVHYRDLLQIQGGRIDTFDIVHDVGAVPESVYQAKRPGQAASVEPAKVLLIVEQSSLEDEIRYLTGQTRLRWDFQPDPTKIAAYVTRNSPAHVTLRTVVVREKGASAEHDNRIRHQPDDRYSHHMTGNSASFTRELIEAVEGEDLRELWLASHTFHSNALRQMLSRVEAAPSLGAIGIRERMDGYAESVPGGIAVHDLVDDVQAISGQLDRQRMGRASILDAPRLLDRLFERSPGVGR